MNISSDHLLSLILIISGVIFYLAAFVHKRFPPK